MNTKKSKPVAIVLGGIVPHIDLITNLKKRGYKTILVDYYEDPPAKCFADEHVRESAMDKKVVLRIAKEKHAALVICVSLDQAISIACYVAEKLDLPRPFSYETALNVTNKARMKSILLDNNISTAKYKIVDLKFINSGDTNIDYPVIVKPVDSTGSVGVARVDNYEELKVAITDAISKSITKNAIIESFLEGEEYNNYFIVTKATLQLLYSSKRTTMRSYNFNSSALVGTVSPILWNHDEQQELLNIARSICSHFCLENTPLLIQTIKVGNNHNVLEFAARVGGSLSKIVLLENYDFDIVDFSVDCFLGKNKSINIKKDNKKIMGTNFIYAQNGTIKEVQGLEELKRSQILYDYTITKKIGSILPIDLSARNKVANFIVTATTEDQLYQEISNCMSKIDVIDVDGHSIMRRDIYLKEHS